MLTVPVPDRDPVKRIFNGQFILPGMRVMQDLVLKVDQLRQLVMMVIAAHFRQAHPRSILLCAGVRLRVPAGWVKR